MQPLNLLQHGSLYEFSLDWYDLLLPLGQATMILLYHALQLHLPWLPQKEGTHAAVSGFPPCYFEYLLHPGSNNQVQTRFWSHQSPGVYQLVYQMH